jgi:hypothetical protein
MIDHLPRNAALGDILANRAWLHRTSPFSHVVASDVFTPDVYMELADATRKILNRGLSETPCTDRFSRGMAGYDAYGLGITHELGRPFDLFLSPEWRDLLSNLFALGHTPYVFAGAHYHCPDGRTGFLHNDFNPIWFPRAPDNAARLQLPDPTLCDFKTGAGPAPPEEKIETIRGAVVIYYLLNDGWQAGDGGETGLFTSRFDDPAAPAARCAPRNNGLIAFECTPSSFHAFLANRRPRTSIIMWVHRTVDEAYERYGGDRIERWQS